MVFGDSPQLILTLPPFIHFSNFTREYKEVYKYIRQLVFRFYKWLRNILEIPMLSQVNKVFRNNPISVSSLLYFVPIPAYFDPPFNNFSKSLKPPV